MERDHEDCEVNLLFMLDSDNPACNTSHKSQEVKGRKLTERKTLDRLFLLFCFDSYECKFDGSPALKKKCFKKALQSNEVHTFYDDLHLNENSIECCKLQYSKLRKLKLYNIFNWRLNRFLN